VATDEFYTDHFNQKGIPLDQDVLDTNRSLAVYSVEQPDWKAVEIPLEIYRAV